MLIERLGSPLQHGKGHQTCDPVIFFYCNRNDPERRDPTVILLALVKQISLALTGLPKPVVAGYDSTKEPVSLSFEKAHELLVSLLDIFPQTTIIIDALDESDPDKRGQLLEVLNTIMLSSTGVVKIFLSSRDDVDIKLRLNDVPNLYIDPRDNKDDISRFIHREMGDSIRNRRLTALPDPLKKWIMRKLVDKAEGMYVSSPNYLYFLGVTRSRFQWVNLQIPYLNGMRLEADIMEGLGTLPRSLEASYSLILATIREGTPRESALTIRALMWMMCLRDRRMQKLWTELSYWPDPVPTNGITTLIDLCQYLVISTPQSEEVMFAHLSVLEHLQIEFNIEDVNSMAAECCMLIIDSNFLVPDGKFAQRTAAGYAYSHWVSHLEESYKYQNHINRPLLDHLQRFLGTSAVPGQSYCRWIRSGCMPTGRGSYTIYSSTLESTPPNPAFVAAIYRFGKQLHEIWACEELDINSVNDTERTLLHVAIDYGNDEVVRILLARGADINRLHPNTEQTPLTTALVGRSKGVIVQLLDKGANLGWYPSTLVAAATQGRPDISILTWLIEREPGMKITEPVFVKLWGNLYASHKAVKEMIRVVVGRMPSIRINEAVVGALSENFPDDPILIQILHERNPETTITEAAVILLVAHGRIKVISWLLSREPPLMITEAMVATAAEKNRSEILEILLARNPHIKLTEAVAAAVLTNYSGSKEVLEILLARGLNLRITEPNLFTVVQDEYSPVEVVELLLAHDLDTQVTERILLAAINHNPKMMGILLARSTNGSITDLIIITAVRSYTVIPMEALILRHPKIEITVAVMEAATGNGECGAALLEILRSNFNISNEIVSEEECNGYHDSIANSETKHQDHRGGGASGDNELAAWHSSGEATPRSQA